MNEIMVEINNIIKSKSNESYPSWKFVDRLKYMENLE